MNDRIERKLKELLPYLIIIGILYLLLPLFMSEKAGAATYLIQLGAFPLTAIGCGVHYKLKKKKNDVLLCLAAPLFYALTALIYGMWRDSWYTVLIYMAGYFLCGYLGMAVTDLLRPVKKDGDARIAIPRPQQRPRRVDVQKEEAPAEDFQAQDPEDDLSLDTSTTEDDIEAILNEIHNRKA